MHASRIIPVISAPPEPAVVRRILLVEDNPADAALVRARLRRLDETISLDWVPTLDEAIERLPGGRYDVVLLDLHLPGTSDLESLAAVLPVAGRTPVVVITGLDDDRLASAALAAGAQDYVVKDDIDERLLGRTIRHAVERARTLRELAEAEARSRELIWSSRYGIFRATDDGTFVEANPALALMLGVGDPAQLIGRRASFGLPDEASTGYVGLHDLDAFEEREVEVEREDGSTVTLVMQAKRVRDRGTGEVQWEGFLHDVTEARRIERELRQTEKMRSLGQFSAGVAHDLNNLLTVVLGGVDAIREELPDGSSAMAELEIVSSSVHRGAHLVRKILAFSRRDRLLSEPFDFSALVLGESPFLSRLGPDTVHLEFDVAGSVFGLGDPGAVQQVLVNLVTNAFHAIESDGRIAVRLHEEMEPPGGESPQQRWAVLRVEDDGTGISPEVLSRIFEPFYSTKERGSGTGLGLSMVHGLVKAQGGTVEVDTEVGLGTTFTVRLPAIDEMTGGDTVQRKAVRVNRTGRVILLVEDEPDIRRAGLRALRRSGYEVLEAANGAEGLALFEGNLDRIGLIVSDIVMPVMDGRRMIDRIRAIDPEVPYLFTSGYSGVDLARDDLLSPEEPLLPKPWTIEELVGAVAERLPRPSERADAAG